MSNLQKLIVTFLVAIIALVTYFILGQHLIAQAIVTVAGAVLAFSMAIEMIKTLRSGSYGVDLLAITAILATLLVGEFWAALIIIVMLVGGEALEDYAANVARRELTSLLQKTPSIAHVREGEAWLDKELADVSVGSRLLIKPMEVIPIDGELLSPYATLD
jgi:cation transport ATPase